MAFFKSPASFTAPTVQKFTSTGTTTGYVFTISTSTTCAVGDTYTNNSNTYTVLGALSAQTGQVMFCSGASAPQASGTLTRSSGAGTSSITFTSALAQATYTTPANALYIRIRMVGGGGGGSSGGTVTGTSATDGGPSLFGPNLLVANGGAKGVFSANLPTTAATATLNSPATGIGIAGASGPCAGENSATNAAFQPGACGANSFFGGAGAGAFASTSGAGSASANSGSGGAGGSPTTTGSNNFSGQGGGAGAYVDATVSAPAASYSYSVGTAGSGGGAGTNGGSGGNGAAGLIIVEEFYQ